MLIRALGIFIKNVGENVYHSLTNDNNRPIQVDGCLEPKEFVEIIDNWDEEINSNKD